MCATECIWSSEDSFVELVLHPSLCGSCGWNLDHQAWTVCTFMLWAMSPGLKLFYDSKQGLTYKAIVSDVSNIC